jgi:hypothetical protein
VPGGRGESGDSDIMGALISHVLYNHGLTWVVATDAAVTCRMVLRRRRVLRVMLRFTGASLN